MTDEDIEKIIKQNMHLQMNLAGIRADIEAAQKPWVGLSEEEILKLAYPIRWNEVNDFEADKAVNFAQMVEAKLKEKNT